MEELKIKKFDIDEVEEITLLTIEQAKKLPNHILACGKDWWLRSPGYSQRYAAYVGYGGDVYEHGSYILMATALEIQKEGLYESDFGV